MKQELDFLKKLETSCPHTATENLNVKIKRRSDSYMKSFNEHDELKGLVILFIITAVIVPCVCAAIILLVGV